MDYIKVVFSDIDGTLLDSSNQIPRGTREKIRYLHDHGIPFILVSSRSPDEMIPIQNALGIVVPMVCYGGALIIDENREPIWSMGIAPETALEIRDYIDSFAYDVFFSTYSFFDWVVDDIYDPRCARGSLGECKPRAGSLQDFRDSNATVHKMHCIGEKQYIHALELAVQLEYSWLTTVKKNETTLEIRCKNATKSSAVEFLCRKYRAGLADAVCFGDSVRDLDMFECAGISVAMGNAPDYVKNQATFVTKDNDHGGVIAFLNHLL